MAPWGPGLAARGRRPRRLRHGVPREGALVLDSAEPEFAFDDRGDVIAVEPVAQTESHRMIEHLMIAANEQVARFSSHAPRAHALPGARASRRRRRRSG